MKQIKKTSYDVLAETAVHLKTQTDQFLFEMTACGTRLSIICAETNNLLNTIVIDNVDLALEQIRACTGYPTSPAYTPS